MFWRAHFGYISGRGALDAIGVIAPANIVLPAISGTIQVTSTLTTTNGMWTGSAPISYTYQWKRNGVNIAGATANAYLLVIADLSATITVIVTATNVVGNASATSAGVGPIALPPPRSAALSGHGIVTVNSVLPRDANVAGVMMNSR